MNIDFIEAKIGEILQDLEDQAMKCVMDESLDKKSTNLRMKPILSTKQILLNALESIKMVQRISQENTK